MVEMYITNVRPSLSLAGLQDQRCTQTDRVLNRGNTCYMNALMQCLRSCATFVNALQVNRCHHERALALGLMGNTGPLIKNIGVGTTYGMMQHDSSNCS
jgi:ubiquitin C-terminal hydrolase